jgi:hypothetical protein
VTKQMVTIGAYSERFGYQSGTKGQPHSKFRGFLQVCNGKTPGPRALERLGTVFRKACLRKELELCRLTDAVLLWTAVLRCRCVVLLLWNVYFFAHLNKLNRKLSLYTYIQFKCSNNKIKLR